MEHTGVCVMVKEDARTTPSMDYEPTPPSLLRRVMKALGSRLWCRLQAPVLYDVHGDAAEATRLAGLLADSSVEDSSVRTLFVVEGEHASALSKAEADALTVAVYRPQKEKKDITGREFYKVLRRLRLLYRLEHEAPSQCERDECCVCMTQMEELVLPCTHAFCSDCIMTWSHDNAFTCPICRRAHRSLDDSFLLCDKS